MKIKVRQKEDFHFIGSGGEFKGELVIDAARHVGGKGRGFRPPELLMYSVAGCMGIHTYEALHKAGKHVTDVEIDTDGERREDHPKMYTKVTLKIRMKGGDLTDADVKNAIYSALTKTCSIAAMVNRVAPITCEYQVESASGVLRGIVTS